MYFFRWTFGLYLLIISPTVDRFFQIIHYFFSTYYNKQKRYLNVHFE